MSRAFDPKALFEAERRVPFPTLYLEMDAELDAVQARKKGISCNNFLRKDDRDAPWMSDFIEASMKRGLTVVLRPVSNGVAIDASALHLEEVWRIPAISVLWETAHIDGGWTNAAEIQLSKLYGYSRQQSKAWLTYVRDKQPAWGRTVYALLTTAQKRATAFVGKRCFGGKDIKLFAHAADHGLMQAAVRLVPKGSTLARVGLDWRRYNAIFGLPDGPRIREHRVDAVELTTNLVPRFNAALRSNVQFLGARGWS